MHLGVQGLAWVAGLFTAGLVLEIARGTCGSLCTSLIPSRRQLNSSTLLLGSQQLHAERMAEVPTGQDDSYVSICVSVKDEHCDIREWVLYHASVGVRKFYVFDTGSKVPMTFVLDDFIQSGLVEYRIVDNKTEGFDWHEPPPGRSMDWQRPIFQHCLDNFRDRHRWMAFIDVDEFIILQDGLTTVPQFLEKYEEHPGIVLSWQMFAFSGNFDRPRDGLLASYTSCCAQQHWEHARVKTIVQMKLSDRPKTVHNFHYTKGHAVNTAGVRVDKPTLQKGEEVSYVGAVLNHYVTRSLYDYAAKLEKRGGGGGTRNLWDFVRWSKDCNLTCTGAVQFGTELAAKYDLNRNVPGKCLPPTR